MLYNVMHAEIADMQSVFCCKRPQGLTDIIRTLNWSIK